MEENTISNETIQSITSEEMENLGKSTTIRYLQYLSIIFSIVFSIAGIIYFVTGGRQDLLTKIQKATNIPEIQKSTYTWWTELWNFIWSKETRKKVNYKEANDFCYNLEPVWLWRIPKSSEIGQTHVDIWGKQMHNNILTDSWWYVQDFGANVALYYNSKTNTQQTVNVTDRVIAWEDVIVKCITERYKIYTNDYGKFPGCKDDNIVLSNYQIWAACNLWATEQWDRKSLPRKCENWPNNCNNDLNWIWNFFQFWAYSVDEKFVSYIEATQKYGEHWFYDPMTQSWDSEKSDYPLGACPPWWHVPTFDEWRLAYEVTWNNILDLRLALRLPMTWYREWMSGNYITHPQDINNINDTWEGYTVYWSSTSIKEDWEWLKKWDIIMLNFWNSEDSPHAPSYITWRSYNGYSIRCLANK